MAAGGLLQQTGAGLNCPSWPVCYETSFTVEGMLPTFHRILGLVAFIFTIIVTFSIRKSTTDTVLKKKALIPFFIIITEGGLGAVSAIYKLPTLVSICHFALSIFYICSLVNLKSLLTKTDIAQELIEKFKKGYKANTRNGILFCFALVFIQAMLGLLVQKSGAGKVCGLGVEDVHLCVVQGLGQFSFWPPINEGQLNMAHRFLGILTILISFYFSTNVVVLCRKALNSSFAQSLMRSTSLTLVLLSILAFTAKKVLQFENRDIFVSLHFAAAIIALFKLWTINKMLEDLESKMFPSGLHTLWSDLVMLTKPKLAGLVMVTVGVGILLAPRPIGFFKAILSFFLVQLVVMGAAILNCYIEKDVDAKMERTKDRPLPAGRMKPIVALVYGWVCLIISLPLIYFYINPVTSYLAAIAAVLYLYAYTPLKQKSPTAVYVGAIPGAIPPVLGWTLVMGEMDVMAWVLFAILFVWQLPHFLAISIYHSQDYGAASIKVYPNQNGMGPTKIGIAAFTVVLAIVAFMPYVNGLNTKVFAWFSFILNLAFVALSFVGFFKSDEASQKDWARNYFWASIIYLPLLLGSMIFFR